MAIGLLTLSWTAVGLQAREFKPFHRLAKAGPSSTIIAAMMHHYASYFNVMATSDSVFASLKAMQNPHDRRLNPSRSQDNRKWACESRSRRVLGNDGDEIVTELELWSLGNDQ